VAEIVEEISSSEYAIDSNVSRLTWMPEVHHVRKLKDVLDHKELWQQVMAAMRRKTIILCVDCHQQLHQGTLPPWKRRKMNVESRIH